MLNSKNHCNVKTKSLNFRWKALVLLKCLNTFVHDCKIQALSLSYDASTQSVQETQQTKPSQTVAKIFPTLSLENKPKWLTQ